MAKKTDRHVSNGGKTRPLKNYLRILGSLYIGFSFLPAKLQKVKSRTKVFNLFYAVAKINFLAFSKIITKSLGGSNFGIGYGGVDANGSKDPASRQRHSVWDDENDEEF